MHNNNTAQQMTPPTNAIPARKERPAIRLARNPNKALQEMMLVIEKLRNIILEETRVLKDTDTKTFMSMQDKKLDVARDYLDGMAQLMERSDEMKTANALLKSQLEEMRDNFGEVVADNHAAINRMRHGMKRLGDRIMEAARETSRRDKQFFYGATGKLQDSTHGTIGVSTSA